MTDNDNDDDLTPLYKEAFPLLAKVSETLKDKGYDVDEIWATLFSLHQDLQAADFGMGSEEHKGHVEAQRDSLTESLTFWERWLH